MPIIDAQDAWDLDSHFQRFFDSTPAERPLRLRQLFTQKFDFNPATGKVSLAEAPQNVSLPPDADRIASIEGINVIYVPLQIPGTTRVRKVEAAAAARLIAGQLGDDMLLLMTNEQAEKVLQLHVILPTFMGSTPALRRMVIERDLPRRTALQQLSNIYHQWKRKKDIRLALEDAFNVEAVTKAFFEKYKEVFERVQGLVRGFPRTEEGYEAQKLFIQTLFNRLMFIYFLSRKGWLKFKGDPDYLAALWKDYRKDKDARNFYEERLKLLFFTGLNNPRSADLVKDNSPLHALIGDVPFLNGGLFTEEEQDKRAGIIVPDEAISAILNDLFEHYNFTVTESTPLDQEVAVDPEMLGKVFEELVTGRHETGSYYTPRPVVSFMCREALKGYLQEAAVTLPTEAIQRFVDQHDVSGLNLASAEKVRKALEKIKVVDPACGSGAYLLGMMHELVELETALYSEKLLMDTKSLYDLKLRIIEENVYGADIDQFAINIAMLRLWLSLAIDYEYFPPPPLPNLDFKIICGDSLTAPDPSPQTYGDLFRHRIRELADSLARLKHNHMQATGREKSELASEIVGTLSELSATLSESQAPEEAVDWRVEFAEVFDDDGFDIIISNPPYLSARRITQDKDSLSQMYRTTYGSYDIYVLFFERGLQLLKQSGLLCLITSNKFLIADYGKILRQMLTSENTLKLIIDLADCRGIFNALISPSITLVTRGDKTRNHKIGIAILKGDEFQRIHNSQLQYLPLETIQQSPTSPFDIYVSASSRTLLERIERNAVSLDSLGLLRTGIMGFDYWALENDIVDAEESTNTDFTRIVTNSQVEPFRFVWGKKIRLYKDTFRNPRIDLGTERISEGTRDFFQKKKIVMRGVARHTTAAWDGEGYALLVAVHGFISNNIDPYFLVGLFNSELFNWLHRIRFYAAKIPQGSLRYPISFWRDLPIRIDRQDLIKEISSITRSLSGKGNNRISQIAHLNDAVLQLYEITEKEIA